MDNLYQWLYDYYALPQLEGLHPVRTPFLIN